MRSGQVVLVVGAKAESCSHDPGILVSRSSLEVCPTIRAKIAEGRAEDAVAAIAKAGVGAALKLGAPEDIPCIEEQWGQTTRSRVEISFRCLAVVLKYDGNPGKTKGGGKKKKAQPDPVPAGVSVLRDMLAQWTQGGAADAADAALTYSP